jgi:hypothetical protein
MQKKLMLPATSFLQTLGSIQDSPGSDPAKMAQDVLFRARSLTENPVDCRIFFRR